MIKEIENGELFDFSHTQAAPLFEKTRYPFEVLPLIKDFILAYGQSLSKEDYYSPSENVWIHKSVKVFPTAYIGAPCIIGEGSEVRQCAFIRGSAIVGKNCVIGNSTELKNAILFDNVQVPHFNYIGDSILGYKSHTGAGVIASNVKSDKSLVTVKGKDYSYETGLKKFGAVLGDNVEVGCNSVLNPGTIVCPKSNVYPLSFVRGVVPAKSIYKRQGEIVSKRD